MLTRALTCSRNVSQEFAVSRSRPTWVAVVIGKDKRLKTKETPALFPQLCKTCGKQSRFHYSFSLRGSCPRRMSYAPIDPRAACYDLPAHLPPFPDRAGLSPLGSRRASEKCANVVGVMHTAFTIFPQAKIAANSRQAFVFHGISSKIFCGEKLLHRAPVSALRKTSLTSYFFCLAGQTSKDPRDRFR